MVPGGSGSANPLIQQLKSDGQILFNRLLSIEGIVSQVIIFMNLKILLTAWNFLNICKYPQFSDNNIYPVFVNIYQYLPFYSNDTGRIIINQGNTRHRKYTKSEVGVILDIIWQQISGNADMKRFSTVLIKSFPMLKHEV